MTPGRIVSLDALTGMTVAAKIRTERSPRVTPMADAGRRNNLLTAYRKSKDQALADPVEFCMFTGVWLMA